MFAINTPYPLFLDKTGQPLDSGLVYFGLVNQNPETDPTTVFWDAAGTQPAAQPLRTMNGYIVRNGTPSQVYVEDDYSITLRDRNGGFIYYAKNSQDFSLATSISAITTNLADPSDPTHGDAMIASKRLLIAGALATTIHNRVEYLPIDPVNDYGVPSDGITNATTAIQAMLDSLAAAGVAADIVFPNGTYLLRTPASETGEPRSYAAAVILRGLKNCRFRGAGGAKFIQDSLGLGAPEFAPFRFEQCENVEMMQFRADGSGINIYGVGAARSSFAFICNHNLDTKVDLAVPNRGIHIHHLKLDNFGGGICSATRTEAGFAYPLVTQGISIHDIVATNIAGQNHFAAITYSENVHVYNCNVRNPLTALAQIGNLFADMSAGVVNGLVENNLAIGFTGGMKAESHTGAGVASNEDRPSYNVMIANNRFLECGDPFTMIYPGAGGGGFYGIKLNGVNHSAIKNTISARVTNATTGGLYMGIQSTSTIVTPVESVHTVLGNMMTGTVLGINHDAQAADTTHKFVSYIDENKIYDTALPSVTVNSNDGAGIIVSKNAKVRGNSIYRTKYSAIVMQAVDQTVARDNIAYNCSTVNIAAIAAKAVFYQAGSGAQGFWEFSNNTILDDRGASAADYGYFFEAGTTYANKYVFNPGHIDTIKTGISFDTYFSVFGKSWVTGGMTAVPREIYATQSPQTGGAASLATWRKGDRAINSNATVGAAKAWVCTVAGAPGTWVSEGVL